MNQPLKLICRAFIARGDIGRVGKVDITWSLGKSSTPIRSNNVTVSSIMDTLAVYSDSFYIPSLTVYDTDNSYHCQVLINSTTIKEDFTISLSSNERTYVYICTYIVCIRISCMYLLCNLIVNHICSYWCPGFICISELCKS